MGEKRQLQRQQRLLGLATKLPEIEITGGQHRAFTIRRKTFAYYLDDHHGDGIVSICCKATTADQELLVEADPENFYVPAYLGAKGWVAMRLDRSRVDWAVVRRLLANAYVAQAPKKLARLVS